VTAEALAAWTAVAGTLATCGGVLWRSGRRDGKIDQVLEQLTELTKDHEARLRAGKL